MQTKKVNNFNFREKADKIKAEIDKHIPRTVGAMLVEGFRDSFDLQRFNDNGSSPWEEVKRRMSGNPWYGFRYVPGGSGAARAPKGTRPKGASRRYYTRTATTRKILHGAGSVGLRDSIYVKQAERGKVVIASDEPHAAVHNEGLKAKIFGRMEFIMPKRQFMGSSQLLEGRAKEIISTRLKRIL